MQYLTEKQKKRKVRDEEMCRDFLEMRGSVGLYSSFRPTTNRILAELGRKYGCCPENVKRILIFNNCYSL